MSQDDAQPTGFRWSTLAAALTFAIGIASFAYGLYAAGVMAYVVFLEQRSEHFPLMLAGCVLYLGSGATLILASIFFWHAKIGPAMMFTIVGLLIPIALFSILGP